MAKHVFLTGPTGSGKTTLLRRVFGPYLAQAGGFVTDAIYGSYGELCAYTLSPAASAGGVTGFTPQPFLDCSRFPPRTDNEVFRDTGVRLLHEAVWYPFGMLDEIGGFELIIPQFRVALYDLLCSDQPLIGVLKAKEEADALRQALGLGDKCRTYLQELHRMLEKAADTQLLVIQTPQDLIQAEEVLKAWRREQLGQ